MKNNIFSLKVKLLAAALVLVCGVAFTGCKPGADEPALPTGVETLSADSNLLGTWTSTYGEIFTISADSLTNGGAWGDCYAGNNLVVKSVSKNSGYIYIKYTRAMNPDYTYSETAADVGKWYAVSYKDLTSVTVVLTGAYKAGGVTSTDTLEEAVATFTVENGYFAGGSICSKE